MAIPPPEEPGTGAGATPEPPRTPTDELPGLKLASELAFAALQRVKNDIELAARMVHDELAATFPERVREVTVAIYLKGLQDLCREVRMQVRAKLSRTGGDLTPSEAAQAEATRAAMDRGGARMTRSWGALTLWDWPLPVTGKRLGEATVEDLKAWSAYRRRRAAFENREADAADALTELLLKSGAAMLQDGASLDSVKKIMTEDITGWRQ